MHYHEIKESFLKEFSHKSVGYLIELEVIPREDVRNICFVIEVKKKIESGIEFCEAIRSTMNDIPVGCERTARRLMVKYKKLWR